MKKDVLVENATPVNMTTAGLIHDIKFPKKKIKKEKDTRHRVLVCGTTSWISYSQLKAMRKAIKDLDPKKIDYIVTGTSRGAEQSAVSIAKELKVVLYQTHPWQGDSNMSFIVQGKAMKLFKPTLVLAFNESAENISTQGYEKLCRRMDIPIKVIRK